MKDNYYSNNRWYDKDSKMTEVLELIKTLPDDAKEQLAATLIQFVNLIRRNKSEVDEDNLSIGKNKTLGLYKAFNKRRWYDKNQALMSAMNILATLSLEDCKKITEGLLLTLDESNSDSK
ncbi:MAG: hypothetical protein V2B14_02245 [bacterium]